MVTAAIKEFLLYVLEGPVLIKKYGLFYDSLLTNSMNGIDICNIEDWDHYTVNCKNGACF